MIDIQYEEQYTLISSNTDTADEMLLNELEKAVIENLEEGNCNFIFLLESLQSAPDSWTAGIQHLQKIISEGNGILVLAAAPEVIHTALEERGIVAVPTLEEAIDYMFMEEIERNFWNEEDGDNKEAK